MTGHETWTRLYGTADSLDHEQLVRHVLDLAHVVNAGAVDDIEVDGLAVAMRVLNTRYRRGSDTSGLRPEDPRLPGEYVPVTPSKQARNRMARVMRLVSPGQRTTVYYMSATAGQIRAVFGSSRESVADELAAHGLATLPRDLPQADDIRVVLYAVGKPGCDTLLSAIGKGQDPAEHLQRILDRLVNKKPFPWENWHDCRRD